MIGQKDLASEFDNYLYVGEKLDAQYLQQLENHLCYKGGKIFHARENIEARVIIENNSIRVVLVDQFLNACSGIEFMRWMFTYAYIPTILIIMEKNSIVFETVISLEAGASDAASQDISVRELAARIKASYRKQFSESVATLKDQLSIPSSLASSLYRKPLYYNASTRRLYFSDSSRTILHGKEAELLDLLILRYPAYVNRNEISEKIFLRDWNPRDRSIDNLVSRLRKSIDSEECEFSDSIIETVRNEGYKLRSPISSQPSDQ